VRSLVLFNDGHGRFSIGNRHWIAFPQLIDINGDGKLDLLTHFDGYPAAGSPVFLNNGSGDFTPVNVRAFESGLFTVSTTSRTQRRVTFSSSRNRAETRPTGSSASSTDRDERGE